MTPRTQPAEVLEVRSLCPDVHEMVLHPMEHAIAFRPGQWVSVHLPLGDRPLVRAYTLAEPPSEKDDIVLCFDRVKGGAASTWLFNARAGERITVSDALGAFVLPEPLDRGLAFVTWFTGIVPLRCMLLHLARLPAPPKTLLVYGAPNADELPYDAQLRALARDHEWFTYVPVLPPAGATLEEGVQEVLARLPDALRSAFPDGVGRASVLPMTAGIRAAVLPIRQWFVEHRGYDPGDVQKETYD